MALKLLLVCVSLLLPYTMTAQVCEVGELRLLVEETDHDHRSNQIKGFVQYCAQTGSGGSRWGTVCINPQNREANQALARVVCRQLGFSDQGASYEASCNRTSYIWRTLNADSCNGEEDSLQQCRVTSTQSCTCYPNAQTHVKVVCNRVCINGEVKLEYPLSENEGRVELCVYGRWVAVCNNNEEDIVQLAGAACSQLGFSVAVNMSAMVFPYPGAPRQRTYLCFNNTCTAASCNSSPDLTVKCLTHYDVITNELFCTGNQEGDYRLINGSSRNEGSLEVCVNGSWRPVCSNDQQIDQALLEGVCFELGFSRGIRNYRFEEETTFCCLINTITCVQCESSCNHRIRVECETCQQANQQTTFYLNHTECSNSIITPLGAVSGVLGALLVATVIGWIVTCVVWKRSVTLKHRKFLNIPDPTLRRNESYTIHQLDDHIYSTTEPTPTSLNYSSMGPNYDMITHERLDTNDVIDHSQQSSNTQPVQPVNPTPLRDETGRNGDDFYDAEEHTYAAVNKKKAKKISEDGEGGREEPPDYEMAVPGKTSWGVMDEGHA